MFESAVSIAGAIIILLVAMQYLIIIWGLIKFRRFDFYKKNLIPLYIWYDLFISNNKTYWKFNFTRSQVEDFAWWCEKNGIISDHGSVSRYNITENFDAWYQERKIK